MPPAWCETLEKRIASYFDPTVSDADLAKAHSSLMNPSGRYDPVATRKSLLSRKHQLGEVVPYAYRPFDSRWVYWDPDTKLLDEKRVEFKPHALPGAVLIEAREKEVGNVFTRGAIVGGLADNFGNGLSTFYPAMLDDGHNALERPNLRQTIDTWRVEQGLADTDIFYHCVATIHAPEYRKDNDDALRSGWPRIPLPDDTDTFKASAALGEQLSRLLDVQRDVPGVSVGALMNGLGVIALPQGQDYKVALGWGYVQINKAGSRIVMPGSGKAVARPWTDEEREGLGALASRHEVNVDVLLGLIGAQAVDVHINHESRWLGVPLKVWNYELGGHQVLKKWLSYRESDVLGRALRGDEILHFAQTARRITEILCMGPALDAAHSSARTNSVAWKGGKPSAPPIL
ncbi:MAG TPA: type ISP restriction/modification enzyme [Tepidisphaeraceae bacterium]